MRKRSDDESMLLHEKEKERKKMGSR